MAHKISKREARLSMVVPSDLKERLRTAAAGQGRKLSALVRESIEEKLARIEREVFEGKMREAYMEMAEENLETSEEFKLADAENLR